MSDFGKQDLFEPLSLIRFEPPIETSDNMKTYHQKNHSDE